MSLNKLFLFSFLFLQSPSLWSFSLFPKKPAPMTPMGMLNLSGKSEHKGGKLVGSPYQTGTFQDGYYIGETSDQWVLAYKLTNKQAISSLKWTYKGPKGGLSTSPLVAQSQVILAFKDGTLVSLDLETGLQNWMSRLEGSYIDAPMQFSFNSLYLSTFSQILYKVDPAREGSIAWAYQMGVKEDVRIRTETKPVLHDGGLLIGNSDGDILNLDSKTGKLNYVFRAPFVSMALFKNIVGALSIHKNKLYFARYDGHVLSLNLDGKGSQKTMSWHFDTRATITASKSDPERGVHYVGTNEGDLYALKLDTGKPLWKKPINLGKVSLTSIFSTERYFYVTASRGEIFCFNRETGELLQSLALETQLLTDSTLLGNTLLVPTLEKSLFYKIYIP